MTNPTDTREQAVQRLLTELHTLADQSQIPPDELLHDVIEQFNAQPDTTPLLQGLQHQLQQMSDVLESITDAFFALDGDWNFTYVNQQAEVLLHRPAAELLGQNVWEAFPEAVDTTFYHEYHRAVRDRVTVTFVEYYPPLETWFEVRGYPTREGISVYFRDVSENRRIQQALRESEERYRAIVESQYDLICRYKPDTTLTFVNQAYARYFGSSPDELIGRRIVDVISPPGEAERLLETARRIAKNGEPELGDFYGYNPDGSRHWLQWLDHPIFDKDGHVVEIQSVGHDITQIKQYEAQVQEKNELLQGIFDHIPVMITLFNPDGRVRLVNRLWEETTGWSQQEAMDHPDILQVIYPEPEECERARRFIQEGSGEWDEFRLTTRSGQRIHTSWANVLLSDGSSIGIGSDITARKQAEREREGLIADLEARNAEMERFTYTVSHDLKSPLITIRGFLGVLREDIRQGREEDIAHDIQHMESAAMRMHHLLEDLLELSRVGRLSTPSETFPLSELVDEVLNMLSIQLRERGIQVRVAPGLPQIHGDRSRLHEVYQNLIENAIRFMGDQPHPRIEIGMREGEAQPVFTVSDNGIGIASRYHEKIFGLFEQLDLSHGGTGIGLALTRRIIEVHNGTIWVESEEGQGSTFCFTLPLAGEHPAARPGTSDGRYS